MRNSINKENNEHGTNEELTEFSEKDLSMLNALASASSEILIKSFKTGKGTRANKLSNEKRKRVAGGKELPREQQQHNQEHIFPYQSIQHYPPSGVPYHSANENGHSIPPYLGVVGTGYPYHSPYNQIPMQVPMMYAGHVGDAQGYSRYSVPIVYNIPVTTSSRRQGVPIHTINPQEQPSLDREKNELADISNDVKPTKKRKRRVSETATDDASTKEAEPKPLAEPITEPNKTNGDNNRAKKLFEAFLNGSQHKQKKSR